MESLLASDVELVSVSKDSTPHKILMMKTLRVYKQKNVCLHRIRSCQPGGGANPGHEEKLLLMKRGTLRVSC